MMTADGSQTAPASDNPSTTAKRPPLRRDGKIVNAMSVDVEDYYQVQAFANVIGRSDWDKWESRVEANTERTLAMFADTGTKATFYTLGWVAERHGPLIRRIVQEGHELGSHGYSHVRVHEQTPEAFRADVRKTKRILEDAGGIPVKGYRAATFSIGQRSQWAFEILAEEGHLYSSSVNPIHHDLYGMPGAPRFAYRPSGVANFEEFPITTMRLFGSNIPCGGGGYFRLLPYALSRWARRQVNRRDGQPCIFYFHPWEIDPGQPRVPGISAKTRFRHYTNLASMESRMRQLLSDFAWDRMDTVFLGRS